MKQWIKYLAAIAILSLVVHLLVVASIPYMVMITSFSKSKQSGITPNKIIHEPPITSDFRKVVMPSPDLLYSACIYDLSEGALLIKAVVPEDTYWSVSFYASNTDNYFVINDRSVEKREVKLLLVSGEKHPEIEGAKLVISPTEKGIVIFRIFIPSEDRLDELIAIQKQASCELVGG
jgi:uncharacterized membrane protein